MYHGYTEPEDKIEARKRRILGTVAPNEDPSAENNEQERQATTERNAPKRQILLIAVLYPIGIFLSGLLGRYIAALMR
jgi:hypothetical protein